MVLLNIGCIGCHIMSTLSGHHNKDKKVKNDVSFQNEPHHEKTGFLHMRKQSMQISCAVTTQLISAFVFATRIV